MALTESLALVLPLAENIVAYHTPISREVFEANYAIIAGTKAALFGKGIAFAADSGPRIAALELREQARIKAAERGEFTPDGKPSETAATALLAELKRLTMVLCGSDAGWEQVPVQFAMDRGAIDPEDWREAESNLVFFTCAYAMASRRDKAKLARGTAGVMGASITSLPLPEFIASLPTSTATNPTSATPLSIPS